MALPTLNHRGYQMATPSPLVQDWLSSYDGEHPLLDVGCAYGINTFEALKKGIPTIALDPEEKHLEGLRENAGKNFSSLLTVVVGSVPHNCEFSDNSVSGILCSEVLHFLDGTEMEDSIKIMRRILAPGGKLVITAVSDHFLGSIDPAREAKFHQDLASGEKWPGVVYTDDDFISRYARAINSNQIRGLCAPVIHFFNKEQLTYELKRSGFKIKHTALGDHSGHPEGFCRWPDRSLQIVAEKV